MEKSDASLQLEEAQEPQFTLRDYAKHRLMEDMILAVRKAEKSNSSYLILVLDDHTKELFAGICNLFEIMSKNVFQLERLELKRKEFPCTAAIYFISPTIKSVNNLISDFDKPDNPQYASAHVFFSSKLSDKLMKEMSECKGLVERVKTLTELNVDLNLYSDNIYHLDMNDSLNLYNMNLKDKGTDMYLNKIALQIFTACAVLNEKPYIQYYGNSKISEIVSRSLVRHFEEFKIRAPGYEFKEPRAKLLILDRSFDMTSPLLHDYSYECLVYETVDSRDQADEICSAGPSKDPHGQSEKILNENDLVWRRFKNEHFAKVMVGISNEISRFVQENKNINAIKKGDGLEVSDMKDVLSSMPKYQELLSIYSKHSSLCQVVDRSLKGRNMIELIRVEQMIISGLNDSGKEVTNKEILKEIEKLYRNLEPSDHARLILLYLAAYEIPEKDVHTLISTLNDDYHDAAINIYSITGVPSSGLIRRRIEVMDKNEFREYSDKLAQTDYEILRTTPTIVKLVHLAQDNLLDQGLFPFIGDIPESDNKFGHSKINGLSKMKGKMRGRWQNNTSSNAPTSKLMIFIIGGISHHEIVELNRIQESRDISCVIIQGGTKVFTPKDFLNQINAMSKKLNKQGIDELEDIGTVLGIKPEDIELQI